MQNETPITETEQISTGIKPMKLWNKNFLLLWQGGLVSMMGDMLYEIALGFWVLAVTGSTGLMGTLMAVSMIPRVLISPFAGVVADRHNRKRIIVLMDLFRGLMVTVVGVVAIMGYLEIWMVFTVGILLGVCAAFFDPAAGSVFPDLVPQDKLEKANSLFAIISSGSRIAGNSLGGFLYVTLGAPLMFLFNGISYIFSSFTETFITVPAHTHDPKKLTFFQDMKEGYHYVWKNKGIRTLLAVGAFLNFFATIGFILILPFFQQSETLGPARYGIFMAISAVGSLLGMVFVSVKKILPEKRFSWFVGSLIFFTFFYVLIPLVPIFPIMLVVAVICGIFNSVVNILLQTVMQLTIDPDKRGKVFSLLGMLLTGLMPIAMALGGWLGEFLPIQWVIAVSMMLCGIPGLFLLPSKDFRKFISFDPNIQKEE
jgi:MFS transporter, DHA3 family, macrolide efflux protein